GERRRGSSPSRDKGVANESIASFRRLHTGGAAGRDRHYRRLGRTAASGSSNGAGVSPPHEMFESTQEFWPSDLQLRGCSQVVPDWPHVSRRLRWKRDGWYGRHGI